MRGKYDNRFGKGLIERLDRIAEKQAVANSVAAQAQSAAQVDLIDMEPEVAAAQHSVWYDGEEEQWKTNFPPCDADDADLVEETGLFCDADFERTLTEDEAESQRAALEVVTAPLRAAALKAREAWFG
jgi:hypothetical protein